MSMICWSEEGYGFELFNGSNCKTIIEFIIQANHENFTQDEVEELRELAKTDDIQGLDDFLDAPVSWVVADAINEIEQFSLIKGYQSSEKDDTGQYIGIDPRYPWSLSDAERKLTKSDCDDLLDKYAKMLGISCAPDFFILHYSG